MAKVNNRKENIANPSPGAICDICHMPYTDRVGLDQPAHPSSLIWELNCLLISHILQISRLSDQPAHLLHSLILLHGCADWSEATLATYCILPGMFTVYIHLYRSIKNMILIVVHFLINFTIFALQTCLWIANSIKA